MLYMVEQSFTQKVNWIKVNNKTCHIICGVLHDFYPKGYNIISIIKYLYFLFINNLYIFW